MRRHMVLNDLGLAFSVATLFSLIACGTRSNTLFYLFLKKLVYFIFPFSLQELYPQFCIHFGGKEDRLPSASTCMNILKLPQYKDIDTLKARLVYAIESEAGFELS